MHKFLSIYLFTTLYMFRAHSAYHQERKNFINTTSGKNHSMLVAKLCVNDEHDVLETCRDL